MLGKSITHASAALFALMLLASCDKKDEAKTAVPPVPSPPAAVQRAAPVAESTPAPVAAAAETPSAAPAPAANPPAAPPGNVLATAEGNAPGTRVEVLELKRTSGDAVMLKFALVNDSDKPFDATRFKGDGYAEYRSVSGTAGGRVLAGESEVLSGTASKLKAGGPVTVQYLSGSPDTNRIPGQRASYATWRNMALTAFVAGFALLLRGRRQRQRRVQANP